MINPLFLKISPYLLIFIDFLCMATKGPITNKKGIAGTTKVDGHKYWYKIIRYLISDIIYQMSSLRYEPSYIKYQVPDLQFQISNIN